MKKYILAYIPVLHAGYKKFIEKHLAAQTLYILGPDLISEFDHLQRKDIRALSPQLIKKSLDNWGLDLGVEIADKQTLIKLNNPQTQLIVPNESEMDQLIDRYLDKAKIKKDSIFLRYDSKKSLKRDLVNPKVTVSENQFSQKIMDQAQMEANKSSDWWRQVGAIIIKDDKIILSGFNKHVPSEKMPYINGDPRGNFHKGENLDLSTAFHAEASLIASAAKKGLKLLNCEIYVTTFPCPACAKLIAYSGIKTVYFKEGYAILDGESILNDKNVKIIQVK
ncbi:MAG: hypothetical protein GW941_02385 [Candidatus Pacebacteria bacterium]|nr:hypothetical protein [Candidatus Paceibacterota bacterium]